MHDKCIKVSSSEEDIIKFYTPANKYKKTVQLQCVFYASGNLLPSYYVVHTNFGLLALSFSPSKRERNLCDKSEIVA